MIENNNIGWAAIQQVIDRGYQKLFYASKDLQYVDTHHQINNKHRADDRKMVPGFSITMKTRPLVIAKLEEFFREKLITVHSNRLVDELFVFIYNGPRAEAMSGYNDDLVMALAIGMYVRATTLKFNSHNEDMTKELLNGLHFSSTPYEFGIYKTDDQKKEEQFSFDTGNGHREDLRWMMS